MDDLALKVLKEAYDAAIDNAYRYDRLTGDYPHGLDRRINALRETLIRQGVPASQLASKYDPTQRRPP